MSLVKLQASVSLRKGKKGLSWESVRTFGLLHDEMKLESAFYLQDVRLVYVWCLPYSIRRSLWGLVQDWIWVD